MVTGMSQVYSIYVYSLLYSGDKLYFVSPLIFRKFDIFSDLLNETFVVCNFVGESLVAKRAYTNSPIMLPNRLLILN